MSSSNPVVKCHVDQCTHFMPGGFCSAAKISVYNNEYTGNAMRAADTQCKAFHQRKTVGDMLGALHNVNVGGMAASALMDGTQVTPTVECFVNNCKHWQQGNLCSARNIEIAGMNASKTMDTDCETFEPKT